MARRKLIAGNWKMNGLRADGMALAADLAQRMKAAGATRFDMLVCPPFTLIPRSSRRSRAPASPSAARTATRSRRARTPATPAPGC